MRFRRVDNGFGDLERRLRTERSEPSAALQRAVVDLVSGRSASGAGTRLRLALAGGLTAALLATAAMLGAATAAGNQGSALSAQYEYQYGELVIICHYPDGHETGITLRVSAQGAKAHLAQHEHDTEGPCP